MLETEIEIERKSKTRMFEVLKVKKARDYFLKTNRHGIVSLIDYFVSELESGREVLKFGMCLDPLGVTKGPFSIEAALKLKQINLGRSDGKTTPLHALAIMAEQLEAGALEKINTEGLRNFDNFDRGCGEAARALTQIAKGDCEVIEEFDD